jgi:hypothetical protein
MTEYLPERCSNNLRLLTFDTTACNKNRQTLGKGSFSVHALLHNLSVLNDPALSHSRTPESTGAFADKDVRDQWLPYVVVQYDVWQASSSTKATGVYSHSASVFSLEHDCGC